MPGLIELNHNDDIDAVIKKCSANFRLIMSQFGMREKAEASSVNEKVDAIYDAMEDMEEYLSDYGNLLNKPSLAGHELAGDTTLSDIGLGNVDDTADIDKPVSTATQSALDLKQDALEVVEFGNADFTYKTYYDTDGVTELYKCVPYSTVSGNTHEPRAAKYGRIVNLTGAFKNINLHPSNAAFDMGYVPEGCEPLHDVRLRQQGSSQNSYLLTIYKDGRMACERYGVGSSIAVTNNAWLNINATYISKQ